MPAGSKTAVKTGRGTEYHENGVAAFEGTFADGLYTGEGTLRDEAGNVLYEGAFQGGLYDGTGRLYADNALVYEGEFAQGLYDGEGKLYEGGQLVYEGDFAAGQRTGQGKAYEDGALVYEGGFQDGLYSGSGRLYYADGTVRADVRDLCRRPDRRRVRALLRERADEVRGHLLPGRGLGPGNALRRGRNAHLLRRVRGGPEVRHGHGLLPQRRQGVRGAPSPKGSTTARARSTTRTEPSATRAGSPRASTPARARCTWRAAARVEGTFAAGAVTGTARYYEGETLVYEGALADGNAQGTGTLYAGGAAVYTGSFAGGFLDGASLLDMAVTDLRETVFAGTELTESRADTGFVIDNPLLQAAVFCNYGYNDAEIVVHRVYLYGRA